MAQITAITFWSTALTSWGKENKWDSIKNESAIACSRSQTLDLQCGVKARVIICERILQLKTLGTKILLPLTTTLNYFKGAIFIIIICLRVYTSCCLIMIMINSLRLWGIGKFLSQEEASPAATNAKETRPKRSRKGIWTGNCHWLRQITYVIYKNLLFQCKIHLKIRTQLFQIFCENVLSYKRLFLHKDKGMS